MVSYQIKIYLFFLWSRIGDGSACARAGGTTQLRGPVGKFRRTGVHLCDVVIAREGEFGMTVEAVARGGAKLG